MQVEGHREGWASKTMDVDDEETAADLGQQTHLTLLTVVVEDLDAKLLSEQCPEEIVPDCLVALHHLFEVVGQMPVSTWRLHHCLK